MSIVIPPLNSENAPVLANYGPLTEDRVESPFGKLSRQTASYVHDLGQRGFHVQASPPPEIYRRRSSANGRFALESHQWSINSRDAGSFTIRMVFIAGATNTILNTWAFPLNPTAYPVYAAELIAFGGMPRLTFMDIQTPAMSSDGIHTVRTRTAKLKANYAAIQSNEQPPDWAVAATTGNFLFARQLASECFRDISNAYLDLLDTYFRIMETVRGENAATQDEAMGLSILQDYQRHHMTHSPGEKFLGKLFGEDWTYHFMNDFLFSSPGEIR